MGLVWLFLAVVVLVVVVGLVRTTVKSHRRAAVEMPEGMTGAEARRAKRETLAQQRYLWRQAERPGRNTSDGTGDGLGAGGGFGP